MFYIYSEDSVMMSLRLFFSYDVNVHLTEELKTDENGMLQGGSCSMAPTAPIGGTWYMLFAGLFLGLIPLRRRMRQ